MQIYFVRHGRSSDWDMNKRQSPDSLLGETGKKQTELLAKRFKNEEIGHVLTSRWPRAFETAKIVGSKLKKEVELFEGIHEKEQHASVYGLPTNSKEFENYQKAVQKKRR